MTTTTNRLIRSIAGMATFFTATTASAQTDPGENQSRRVGEFEIYYSAIPLDLLPEQISKRYNLQRGPNAAMLQVTVRRNANGSDSAIAARSWNQVFSHIAWAKTSSNDCAPTDRRAHATSLTHACNRGRRPAGTTTRT